MRECLYFLFVFLTYETLSMVVPPETDCYNKGFICYDEDRFYQCVDIGDKTVTLGEPQFCPEGLKCNDSDEIECGEPWSAENDTNISMAIYSTTLKSNIQTDVFEESDTVTNAHDKNKYTDSLSPELMISPINTITTTEDEFVSFQKPTDQFLEINNQYVITNNQIQTEPTANEEAELVTELNKLVITTDNDIKTSPLETNEFTDVQTTQFPPVDDTNESLSGWQPDKVVELGNAENTHTTEAQRTMLPSAEGTDEYLYGWESDEIVELGNAKNTQTTGVETTILPSTKDTDKSLPGWKPDKVVELGNEKNIHTTEVETLKTDPPEYADYDYVYDFFYDDVPKEKSTTAVHGTLPTNEEEESTIGITSNAKSSADDVTTRIEVLKSTTEGNIPSTSQSQNLNFTTEQNEISASTEVNEVTLNLETENSKTEVPVDNEQTTLTQNAIGFYQTFQQENSKYTTENKLFTFETETTIVDTKLTGEGNKAPEFTDSKSYSTQNGDESTESKISLLNYTNDFITSQKYAISTTTTEGFASSIVTHNVDSSDQTTSGYSEETKIEDTQSEVVTSDTDTTLSVEEISRMFTTTESDLIGSSIYIEEVTSTQSESTINSILNSTMTENTLEDSKTTVTEDENELYDVNNDPSMVTTDSFVSTDIDELVLPDENLNSQSALISNTANTETTSENASNTGEDINFIDESVTELMTRQTTDTTSGQKSEVFEEPTTINETSITSTHNTERSASFASGIFVEELRTTEINILPDKISQPIPTLIIETTTVSVETDSFIDESNSKETKAEITEVTPLESEGLSSIQKNIFDTDVSTIRVKELDDDTENSYRYSASSEAKTTESFSDQETYIMKENKLNENVTSTSIDLSIENSTDLTLDLSIFSTPSIDSKDIIEVDNNFTTKDTLSETERQETSKTTEPLSTLSPQGINTTNNSASSTEFEVTATVTSFLINHVNNTQEVYDNEMATVSLSLNTTEPVSSEEESDLPESRTVSTSSDVTTSNYIFTNHVTTNSETLDTEFSSNEYSSTIASVSTFTCPSVGKFPDPKSCSKFYLCINAFVKYIAVALDCPKGTLYDSAVKECTGRPVQCPGDILLTCTMSGVYPHPTDCSRYYKCLWRSFNKNFILKQFRCPRGTRYHSKNRRCERTSAAECGNSFLGEITDDTSFKCVEAGRFAVESGCREYYECKEKNGKMTSYRKTCSESKLFDAEWGRCRKAHLVVCPFGDYDSRETSEIDDRSVE